MNPIALYILKVSGAFSLFYLCYRYFLSTDTYFIRNRFYLLGSIFISLISPLVRITIKTIIIQPVYNIIPNPTINQPTNTPIENTFWALVIKIILVLYFTGVLFFLIRLLWAYYLTIQIIVKSEHEKYNKLILAYTQKSISPFSLFKWLVIPKTKINQSDFNNIVQHESIHSRQYHSVDLFLAEIMVAFQWFNPFVWMLKKAIVENHEYIVDHTLLQQGVNAKQYQYSLLSYVFEKRSQNVVANHFSSNLIKKRIRMMNKNQSPQWHRMKNFLILVSTTMVVLATSTFETKVLAQSAQNEPMVIVDNTKTTVAEMQKIDPSLIKTVTILKDTAAVSLYGKEGKNGVILIELKNSSGMKAGKTGDITIIGYAKDSAQTEKFQIRSDTLTNSTFKHKKQPLVFVDGKKISFQEFSKMTINIDKLIRINGEKAIKTYGEEGKDGVLLYFVHQDLPDNDQKPISLELKNMDDLNKEKPLYIMDGKIIESKYLDDMKPEDISGINILKGDKAINKYGDKGKNGVIEITTKKTSSPPLAISFSQNPATEKVSVIIGDNATANTYNVQIFNKLGTVVYKSSTTEKTIVVPLTSIKDDLYVVSVTSKESQNSGSGILIVKH